MSLSSSRVGYRHRCDIQRDVNAGEDGTDEYGDPVEQDWQDHLTEVNCRAWSNTAREPIDERSVVTFEDRRVSVALVVDVTEADRVTEIRDRKGNVIFEGPMGIEGITRHTDHKELALERIR